MSQALKQGNKSTTREEKAWLSLLRSAFLLINIPVLYVCCLTVTKVWSGQTFHCKSKQRHNFCYERGYVNGSWILHYLLINMSSKFDGNWLKKWHRYDKTSYRKNKGNNFPIKRDRILHTSISIQPPTLWFDRFPIVFNT